VISSLFPHLPHRSRTPFGVGLAILFLVLIALALLRWQAPLITISALGFPLVFLLYLHEADVHRDLPVRSLVLTAAIGIGLGVGWASLTGTVVADFYDVALGAGESEPQALFVGLGTPIGSAVLMLVPAVVVRLLRPAIREPLDGYVIGALGAVAFTAAATLTRLAPQFATGLTAGDRPVSGLLVQAGIQGVAMPLTAAALGGLVGAALWFSRPRMITSSVLVTLALYTGLGLMEVTPVLQRLHLGLHVLVAVFALLALRIGLQVAGVAAPAASRHTTYMWLLTRLGAGMGIAAAAGVTAAVLATPVAPEFLCPPDCGRPPIAKPVESNPRFVAQGGEFSVQYPGPGSAYEATLSPDGVELNFVAGDTGTMELFGLPAADRTPKQIAEELIGEYYPDATTDYEIPNALVGYQPGYGVVLDEYPQDSSGTFTRLRLLVMVAVKNGYALVAAAIGPYHEFSPDFGTGHPSGVNLQLAIDMGKYVNSFRWRSEQPT
jgi:hypothetical protein